ncbi:hypothetical protein HZS_5647, partial [Henneguya salminicola]
FESYRWNFISDTAKDFLVKVFNPDAHLRISAQDALLHSWFIEESITDADSLCLCGFSNCIYERQLYIKNNIENVKLRKILSEQSTQFSNNKNSICGKEKLTEQESSEILLRESQQLLKKVCHEITKNTPIEEDSALLYKILNKATINSLVETFNKIKGSYPVESGSPSREDLIQEDTSHFEKIRKMVILRKETKDQKIGIIVMSTRQFYCIVAKILPESLAQKEGTLQLGDRIISINGIRLVPKSHEDNGRQLSDSEKAATVVKQTDDLFNEDTREIKIIVEPGYDYLIKNKPLLEKKVKIAENICGIKNYRYLRVVKSLKRSPNTDNVLFNEKCMKITNGEILAISDFTVIENKW